MKRIIAIIAATVFIILLTYFLCDPVGAETFRNYEGYFESPVTPNSLVQNHLQAGTLRCIEFYWVADSSDAGFFTSQMSTWAINGWIDYAEIIPYSGTGGDWPTNNYDIQIKTEDGIDIFGGNLLDMATSGADSFQPIVDSVSWDVPVWGNVWLVIDGNEVRTSTGIVRLFYNATY